MDPERARIQADLKGLLEGDIRCDELFTQMYASDASIYEIKPLGVVRPKHTKDVVACVQYANQHNIPLIARGAGTGVAGEALGAGLMLDFSHYMRRLISVDGDTVRLQPGLVLSELNRHLAPAKRVFGPDPATRSVTTMGSVMALDASGSHWLQYGTARDKILSMQVVLGDGSVIRAEQHDLSVFGESGHEMQLVRRMQQLLGRNQQLIQQYAPKTRVSRSGYYLHGLIQDGKLDLAKLFVGSEGTLGLITEITLKTDPLPAFRGVALLFFERLEYAARAALELSGMGAAACDLMDRRLLSIARENDRRYNELLPINAEAMLLVEFAGDESSAVREQLQQTVSRIQRRKRLAFDSRTTMEPDERNFYWRLVRRVVPRLYRLTGSERPLPFVEDIVVPPEMLPAYLMTAQKIFQKHQVTATLFAHAGHGQLHFRPFLDLAHPDLQFQMQRLADELYAAALEIGGGVGGEHGDGLSRTWFLRKQFGELYSVFRDVKRIFDPNGVLNPGKIVADNPQPLAKNFRHVILPAGVNADAQNDSQDERLDPALKEPATKSSLPVLNLTWDQNDLMLETRSCNGCGRCRTLSAPERMCPIFRASPAEEASPRAKANLLRGILTGQLKPDELSSDAMKDIADLCVNCHQCRLECPARVDIPKMMIEAKSQYVAANGLRPAESLMARIDGMCQMASRFDSLSNWMIGNRTCRWILERVTGLAQGRKLPRVSSRSFVRIATKMQLTKPSRNSGRKVVYFVDSYANWMDTQLARAMLKVFQHNGIEVYVHPAQRHCGMSLISVGAIDRAKKLAAKNIELLVDAVRQGYHIVASEPAAALCLKHEYLNLFDDEDTRLVAENTSEACQYLWKLHEQGELELDFLPVNESVGYHMPCHLRALQIGSPGERLMHLIPGLKVHRIEKGCSGMAGTYGFSKKNFRRSLRIGRDLINAVRDPVISVGTTECSTCKMQMEQGTTKATLHPLKLLAYAYRLMPEIEKTIEKKHEGLYIS
jgi:FAD/FMN-containing dehydrogenase/Fe-S oxidoreductase